MHTTTESLAGQSSIRLRFEKYCKQGYRIPVAVKKVAAAFFLSERQVEKILAS